ncbi:MAG: SusC/RagA family TonB-linked outer membrane protein [Reichenbachiella sp.]|uniref:SusC/RagA family TonB-linked outer membrane protein n=1 Tax=Reichenbachiella sp. TaxID=2184521 RepID=UPI0032668F73
MMNKSLHKLILVFLLTLGHQGLHAQQTITGSVKDQNGPLIGATVQVVGTTLGTVCDIDGRFTLDGVTSESTLSINFIGYVTQTVNVGNRSVIDVILEEDAAQLEEVVVSALGFKQKRDNLGSTYSKVKSDDIVRSGEATLINGLSGKAAGVKISRSNGDPGAGSSIQIRGQNTIGGSTQPLIIVDGVPLGNNNILGSGNGITGGRTGGTSQQSRLNDINPNDIESMQILKGASAASLWGSRAANGVIVITTKKGKSGKPTISYNVTYSMDEINRRHPIQNTYGQGENGTWIANAANSWGDKIADRTGGGDEVDFFGERFVSADGTTHYPITNKNSTATYADRNFDQVFQRGHFVQHDLSVSGGNEKSTFFFSFGKLNQDGIIRNSDYDKHNLRLNNDTRFNDWLGMSTKASYVNIQSNRIQQNSNLSGMYLGLLRTAPDFDNSDYIGTYYSASGESFPRRQRSYRSYLGARENPTYSNPQWTTDEQIASSDVNRFSITPQLDIDPTSWLNFTFRGGVDFFSDKREYFFPKNSASSRNVGIFAEDVIRRRQVNFDAIARTSFDINQNINLESTIGFNYNERTGESQSLEIRDFQVNTNFPTYDLTTDQAASSLGKSAFIRRSNRGYGLISLALYDQVNVNLSGALEAASTIADNFFYPSADVAWRFTQLPVFDNIGVLSFGKLRASWGKVGVQPSAHKSQTLTDAGFSASSFSDALDVSLFGGGYRLDDDKGNPNLKPEIKTEYEVGTDLRFFDNRLGINFTYYYNKIEDILLDIPVPSSTGFFNQYSNAATMENKGMEVDLNYDIIRNSDWTVGITANFNNNENTVLDLRGAESIDLSSQSISSRAVAGHSLGALWATQASRNDDGTLELDANNFPFAGTELGVIGDPNPDWRGGIGFNAKWKNLSLNVLFEHSQGGQFADRTRIVLYRFGTHQDVSNEVTLEQDLRNVNGILFPAGSVVRGAVHDFGGGPVLLDEAWYTSRGGGFGSGVIYDLLISEDASWTKLREVSLSYTLNNNWLQETLKLSSVQFTATGRNLLMWTDIVGVDPESSQFGVSNGFGVEYFTNPSTRSILFSLKITY